jgi:hypothetical protein
MIAKEIEQTCMASLDRFMMALNAHDAGAMDEEMHFPHVRLAEGRLVVYERPGSNPMDLFTSLIQKSIGITVSGPKESPFRVATPKSIGPSSTKDSQKTTRSSARMTHCTL